MMRFSFRRAAKKVETLTVLSNFDYLFSIPPMSICKDDIQQREPELVSFYLVNEA